MADYVGKYKLDNEMVRRHSPHYPIKLTQPEWTRVVHALAFAAHHWHSQGLLDKAKAFDEIADRMCDQLDAQTLKGE